MLKRVAKGVMSSFKLQASFPVDYSPASIKKWRSERTGLQLCLIDQQSPVVNGYFAVATEIEDDSGCPHTLEHLIFMGSKKYPYKGLLDTLGNLAFSSTNAWTDQDQTVYTLSTAGWEGFKMLLPVYLDHLFNPTLTDEACYTEVYHVDSEAKEKGVVFSEMTANVNNAWFISTLEAHRILYGPKSGYSSETGGLIESLRTLTNERIRKYHADNYRPDNLNVIITGSVDETELLKVMEEFDSELPNLPLVPNKRPFIDTPATPPLTEDIIKNVEFPDKDESTGQVGLSWIGPDANETVENVALDILGTYLTNSAISLLQANLVEIEDPLAVEVYYYTDDYKKTGINLTLSSVPTLKLQECRDKVVELLQNHAKDFDLQRIREVLETSKSKYIFQTEKSPSNLATIAIEHFLYGKVDGSDLLAWSKDLKEYDILANWSKEQWCELLQKYFVDNKSVSILATPSSSLYAKHKKENKELLEKRKLENDLEELGRRLKKAMEYNDRPIPDDILTQFGQPDPSKVNFIKSTTIGAGLNDNPLNKSTDVGKYVSNDTPEDFPLYIHFEDIDSQFVSLNILLSSFTVDTELLPYLVILEDIFSLPVELSDGTEIPYETVISEIKKDTLSAALSTSFYGSFEELVTLKIRVARENYSKAIEWFGRIMYQTKFDKSRVRVSIEKLVNSLSETKRSGSAMLASVSNRAVVTDRSIKKSRDPLFTEEIYKNLLQEIDNGGYDAIETKLEKIRDQLFHLQNLRVFICGSVEKLKKPVSSWASFIETTGEKSVSKLNPIPRSASTLTEVGVNLSSKAYLLSAPASEATYLQSVTKIPTDYLHPDIPKIVLASAFLQAIEGPFWRGIRGTGLLYGANIGRDVECGQLSFDIYRGADGEECLKVAKKIIEDYATGARKFDESSIQGAISSLVNRIAEQESNNFNAATDKFLDDVLMQRGPDYNTKSLAKLRDVTEQDLVYAIKKYYVPLFESDKSCVFACVHPSKVEGMQKMLNEWGYEVSVEELAGGDESEEGEEYDSEDESGDSEDYSESESEED